MDGIAFEGVYKRGLAVGESDMRNDQMNFMFRSERFSFPTIAVAHCIRYNGYFYTAKVAELRKISKRKH